MKYRRVVASMLIAVLLSSHLILAKADMSTSMQSMFTDMVNVTPGTAYMGQRRGIIAGGSVFVRNKNMNPKLIAFEPPGFRAGCGGIDLFGGSFSFINMDQFIQTMRSIGQNAAGYAFGLALEGLCPTCAKEMKSLQSKIEALNKMFKGSCETAKQAVNATGLKAWNEERVASAGTEATQTATIADSFLSFIPSTGAESAPTKLLATNQHEKLQGNVVWQALLESDTALWFTQAGGGTGQHDMRRALLSLTGTVIGTIADKNADGEATYNFETVPPSLTLKDFLTADGVKSYRVYDCASTTNTTDCLVIDDTATMVLPSMRKMVREMMFGSASSIGIVAKISSKTDAYDLNEQKFAEAAPLGVLGLLSQLSSQPMLASTFADSAVEVITLEMLSQMVADMHKAIHDSVAGSAKNLDTAMLARIEAVRDDFNAERANSGQSVGNLQRMLDMHRIMRDSIRTQNTPNPLSLSRK